MTWKTRSPFRWTNLDLLELIKKSNDLLLVAWIGHTLSLQELLTRCIELEIQARQLRIGTRVVWQQETDYYVVSYHDGTGKDVN